MGSRTPRSIRFVVVVAVASVVLAGCGGGSTSAHPGVTLVPAPDRKPLGEISGPSVATEDPITFRPTGGVSLINFWASWCVPCRAEAKLFAEITEILPRGCDVTIYGINEKDSLDEARRFVKAERQTFPSIYDPDGSVVLTLPEGFRPPFPPTTLVTDPTGKVAGIAYGELQLTELRSLAAAADPAHCTEPTG